MDICPSFAESAHCACQKVISMNYSYTLFSDFSLYLLKYLPFSRHKDRIACYERLSAGEPPCTCYRDSGLAAVYRCGQKGDKSERLCFICYGRKNMLPNISAQLCPSIHLRGFNVINKQKRAAKVPLITAEMRVIDVEKAFESAVS